VYHWFLLPLLLALVAESNWRHRWFRGALAMLIVVAVSAPLRDVAKSFWATGPQSVDAASRDVERIVPAGAKVLVSNRSYFLIRRHVKDLITDFDTAPDVKSVDYCVFGMFGGWEIKHTNGVYLSAELDSPENAAYLAAHFEEMTNNLPRVRPTLLGIPLSGFPVGYGTVIYKRRL